MAIRKAALYEEWMIRFRNPGLIPILFILGSTLMLGGLGCWQLQRLYWKEALIAQAEEAQKAPPLTALPARNAAGLLYRSITLKGAIPKQANIIRLVDVVQGQAVYCMVAPVLTPLGTVAADLGCIPQRATFDPQRLAGKNIQIEGILRSPREKRFFVPKNDAAHNVWFYEDMAALADIMRVELFPYIIEATKPVTDGGGALLPELKPNQRGVRFRNDHLGYAVTWFGLMLAGWVVFAAYFREKPVK